MSSQSRNVGPPQLSIFAVCDDVRVEQGGKFTLVGYYGKSIIVQSLPITLPKICFFAQFESSSWQPNSLRIRLINPSGNVMFETPSSNVPQLDEPSVIPREYQQATMIFQFAPMTFSEQGEHFVEYELSGWPPYRIRFYVAPAPAPANPQANFSASGVL
jgi:hypothetical protein